MINFDEVLSLLPAAENPKQTTIGGVPYILHEDHRWVLPIVYFAQQNDFLPTPCTVVMYDRHTDTLDPFKRAGDELRQLRQEPTLQGILSLCEKHLMTNDADWLKAGMQLGLFGDVVIFGAYDDGVIGSSAYNDHLGDLHHIIKTSVLPRSALSDAFLFDEFGLTWEILGWKVMYDSGWFLPDHPKVFLTIDLDCFAIPWNGHTFAWPNKIFESEFSENTKIGWTGRTYLEGLASKAGLVAIAREHGCCGGTQDAEDILQNLIHYGFGGKLSFDNEGR